MKCQICNKESGEYSLCAECFASMQNGEVKQCVNCKRWYKVGSVCECLKQDKCLQNTTIFEDTPSNQEDVNKEESMPQIVWYSFIKPLLISLLSLILALGLPFGIIYANMRFKETGPHGEETSWFTALTKEKPGIYTVPSYDPNGNLTEFLGYEFEIKCHDDYEEVILAVYFKDKNYNLVKTDYITFKNCKEGKNYKQLYTFTTLEILTIEHVSYELYKYK